MHIPDFMRRVNRAVTNRLLGLMAWILPPFAVIHHVGRKSGKRFRTPVVAFGGRDGFVVPMTYGRDVDWAQNLTAAGGGAIMQMGKLYKLQNPRIVDGEQVRSRIPFLVRSMLLAARLPGYLVLDPS